MITVMPPVEKELTNIKKRLLDINCDSFDLKKIINDFLSQESKMIRSLVACLFFKGNISEEQYKILIATELIHNASLIHDDVIDESIKRRECDTINLTYDNKLAVIVGDYLISIATKVLLDLNNSDVIKIFFETISKMCIGESSQYFSKGKIPTIEAYLIKTQYKTAELFKACMVSMALYSKSEMINEAREFALNYGIAFQIKNDLDDYKQGIEKSQDIKDENYTAPVILLNSIEYNDVAIEKTLDLIHNYCEKAKDIIQNFDDDIYKDYLIGLIDKLWK